MRGQDRTDHQTGNGNARLDLKVVVTGQTDEEEGGREGCHWTGLPAPASCPAITEITYRSLAPPDRGGDEREAN